MEKSTIGSRLKKKKGKEEEEKKKEEEYLAVVLVCELPAARPRRLRVDRELSPPSRRRRSRATIVPARGDETSPRAGRETEATHLR
ncbi:hypothetical protein BHE74_00034116 [Ensete ventricosum]|nr:hypothetical protein BHE74_00034116 [Ensete ventricosum]